MAQLIVRNIGEDLIRALKIRAAHHGHSAEQEHREILRAALVPERPTKSLKDLILEIPDAGTDADFERPRDLGRRIKL